MVIMFDYYVRLIVQILSINHENFGIKFVICL